MTKSPKNTEPPDDDAVEAAIQVLRRTDPRVIQRHGFHFQRNDFYSPLNDLDFLDRNRAVWAERFEPLEIDWNVDAQLRVAEEVAAFAGELREVPVEAERPGTFHWNNQMFSGTDALTLYGLARARQPARWIEIGSGFSSLLLARALERNEAPCEVILIEPYPKEEIFSNLPQHWTRGRSLLQHVPLEVFDRLHAGDVLFYDGSHCAKTGSDVNYFFFKLLPRLRPGVLIHLHDIFLPDPYPEHWLFDRGQSWNEQFVLQAFLMHNRDYSIEIANYYLYAYRAERLRELYPMLANPFGCSFWMTRR